MNGERHHAVKGLYHQCSATSKKENRRLGLLLGRGTGVIIKGQNFQGNLILTSSIFRDVSIKSMLWGYEHKNKRMKRREAEATKRNNTQ